MSAPVNAEALGDPWTVPLDQIDVADPRIFQSDVWPDWFARLRRDDPVHFTADSQYGAVLVGDQIQGHHGGGDQPADFLLRVRHHLTGSGNAVPAGDVHRHGPAQARFAADGCGADRGPWQSCEHGRHDPGTRHYDPGQSAAKRNLRLGRTCFDRTDDSDAGDLVRLSIRAAPGPGLLVEYRDHEFQRSQRDREDRGRAVHRTAGRWPRR